MLRVDLLQPTISPRGKPETPATKESYSPGIRQPVYFENLVADLHSNVVNHGGDTDFVDRIESNIEESVET